MWIIFCKKGYLCVVLILAVVEILKAKAYHSEQTKNMISKLLLNLYRSNMDYKGLFYGEDLWELLPV